MDTFRNQIHAWTFLPPLLSWIRHHIRCQQLPHLQRLSLVFTPSSQPSSPVHRESAPALSPFSSNTFHCTTLLLPTYSIQAPTVIPITLLKDQSLQAFLIYAVIFCFNHLLAGWLITSCWGVSGRACGSNHHSLLYKKLNCWASVPILVNTSRKKRKLQTKRQRIIYA